MAENNSENPELEALRNQLQACQGELQAQQASFDRSQKVQSALYRIAEAASGSADLQAFYAAVHRIVGELMYAKNFFIALYDDQSDWITWDYYVDTVDIEPPAPIKKQDHLGATGWVLRHGKTVADADGTWLAALAQGEAQVVGTASNGIAVPLRIDEKIAGVILVQSYLPEIGYQPEDVQVLEFVAKHIAAAMTRARALEEIRQRNAELEVINSVQSALAVKLEFQGIVEIVGSKLTEIFSEENVGIGFLDKATQILKVPYAVENGKRLAYFEVPHGDRGLVNHALKTRKPLVINTQYSQRHVELGGFNPGGTPDPKSWLGVPIIINNEAVGAFTLQNWERENAYSEADVRLLQTLAGSLGVALENARLFDALQTRNREIGEALERERATGQILSVIASSPTQIQPVLDVIAENAALLSDSDDAVITYVEGDFLKLMSHYGHIPILEVGDRLPLNRETVVGRSVLEKRALQTVHVPGSEDSEYPAGDANARQFGYRMTFATPLLRHGVAIGAITIRHIEPKLLTDRQIELVRTFADQAVIAIENVHLFDEVQKRNQDLSEALEQQTATSEVLRALSGFQPDLRSLLEIIAVNAAKVCGADDAHIYRIEGQTLKEWTHRGPIPGLEAGESLPLNRGSVSGRAIVDREIIHIHDSAVEVDESEYPISARLRRRMGYRTILSTPLLRDGEPIGGITIRRKEVQPFSDRQIELLKIFADQAVIAIENVRLFEETSRLLKETEQRNAELAVINSIQEGLVSQLDLQQIYELVGEKIRVIFNAQVVTINYLNHAAGINEYRYNYENGQVEPLVSIPFVPLIEDLIRQPRTLLVNGGVDKLLRAGKIVIPSGKAPRSFLVVPLLSGNQVSGYISLQNTEQENAFSEADARLLETVGNGLSIALENARLFDRTQQLLKETEQRAAELAIINSVQEGVAAQVDFQAIIDLVGEKIREVFQADTTFICLYNEEDQTVEFPFYIERGHRHSMKKAKFGPGLTSHIIQSREPLLLDCLEDAQGYDVISEISPGSTEDLNRTFLGVPVVAGDQVIGVISVQSYRPYAFGESDVRLLSTVAASMGVALENARLFVETQQRAAELETVNTVSHALVAETELGALIQLTGEQMRRTFNADIVYVALLNEQTNQIEFPYGYGEEFAALPLGDGLTSKIIETNQPLLINRDMESQREALGATLVGKQARSYLGVPIVAGRQAIGVISVQNTREEGVYTDADLRLLSTIAANVGTAIRNARLFDEISRQKKYYEMIIANSPAAIILIDRDLRITGWNPAAERLFGYQEAEALGQNVDDLVARDPEMHAEAEKYSLQVLSENRVHLIARRNRKDGSLVDVEVMGLPVLIEGQYKGYVVIYHDITELERARQQAIEANQAKSAFLANMSHELRTPLNAIIGFTRIVRRKGEGALPEKQIENLDKVLISSEHLLNLINTVLDISKIESGRMDVQISHFQVKPLIDLVAATSQPLIRQDAVRLVLQVDQDLPLAHTDLEKMKQILLNLVSNAAKFTHQGQISISAGQEGDLLVITVRDTGIGIPVKSLPHIFEEFQQADTSTTREYGGTGLGLSISRSLARLLGGDLNAESVEGQGSTFTLAIPFNYAVPQAPEQENPEDSMSSQDFRPSQPLVLVIDDDPDAQVLLKESLGEAGFQVIATSNGAHGIEIAQRYQPLAITLDIMMPNKDGWQVLHELKADPSTRRIPVILISILDKKALGFRLGAADYLVKPIKESDLRNSLERLTTVMGGSSPKRLLVVDDDPDVIDLIKQLLEGTQYQVEAASDGRQALEAIRLSIPDALLLDLIMPRLDGFQLIEILHSEPDLYRIPIIVLTAKSLTSSEVDALSKSAQAVIQKQGLQSEVLLGQIESALTREQRS